MASEAAPSLLQYLTGAGLAAAPALRCEILCHCIATDALPAAAWGTVLEAVGRSAACADAVIKAAEEFKDAEPAVAKWIIKASGDVAVPLATRLRLHMCVFPGQPFPAALASSALLAGTPLPTEAVMLLDASSVVTPTKTDNKRKRLVLVGETDGAKKATETQLALKDEGNAGSSTVDNQLALVPVQPRRHVVSLDQKGPKWPYTFQGDERIIFKQPNPKKKGTLAAKRYKKYSQAKTPNGALDLGATKRDLGYDFDHGSIKLDMRNKGRRKCADSSRAWVQG